MPFSITLTNDQNSENTLHDEIVHYVGEKIRNVHSTCRAWIILLLVCSSFSLFRESLHQPTFRATQFARTRAKSFVTRKGPFFPLIDTTREFLVGVVWLCVGYTQNTSSDAAWRRRFAPIRKTNCFSFIPLMTARGKWILKSLCEEALPKLHPTILETRQLW